eukprot:485133-Prorocentrum_minimum.AAC.1
MAGGFAPRLQVKPLFQLTGDVRTPSLTQELYTSITDVDKRVRTDAAPPLLTLSSRCKGSRGCASAPLPLSAQEDP